MLSLLPFSQFLRTPHEVRVMPHANPFGDIVQHEDAFAKAPQFYAPIREIDALGPHLCKPFTVHAQLAMLVSRSFGVSARNACGTWPPLTIAGTTGSEHVAALDASLAKQLGVAQSGKSGTLFWFDKVRPIAPKEGRPVPSLQRMQVIAAPSRGQPKPLHYSFETRGSDLLAITNLYSTVGATRIESATAGGEPAKSRYADAGFSVFSCDACTKDEITRWDVTLDAIEENIDVAVLSPPAA
jgi:hypothetical protein